MSKNSSQNTAHTNYSSPITSLFPPKLVVVSLTPGTCLDVDDDDTSWDGFAPLATVEQNFITPSRVNSSKVTIGNKIKCWLKCNGHFRARFRVLLEVRVTYMVLATNLND